MRRIGAFMSSTVGHHTKVEICDVKGCESVSERSINIKQVTRCNLVLKDGEHRSVHLCKEHYKQYKKQTKTDRSIDAVYDAAMYD